MNSTLFRPILQVTVLVGILLWSTGCEQSSPADPEKDPPPDDSTTVATFSDIQTTIFDQSCALSGCHGGGSARGSLSLEAGSSYGNLVNVTSPNYGVVRVVPNDPNKSLLYLKVIGDANAGGRMPPGGQLSQAAIDKIKEWIENGAKND